MTPSQKEARERVRSALDHIYSAQESLTRAGECLFRVTYVAGQVDALDRVINYLYTISGLLAAADPDLDPTEKARCLETKTEETWIGKEST